MVDDDFMNQLATIMQQGLSEIRRRREVMANDWLSTADDTLLDLTPQEREYAKYRAIPPTIN